MSGTGAAAGAVALREGALSVAGPSAREVPAFGTLVAFAMLGGLAAPSLRRTAHRVRAAERHVRQQRIRRYVAAGDRGRANAA
jgi:hypothetical protein